MYVFLGKIGKMYCFNPIKLNYKCEFNGTDNKCNYAELKDKPTERDIKKKEKSLVDGFSKDIFEHNEKYQRIIEDIHNKSIVTKTDKYGNVIDYEYKLSNNDQKKVNNALKNIIKTDALELYNWNSHVVNNDSNDSNELYKLLDTVTTKTNIVVWRGVSKSEWDQTIGKGLKEFTRNRFLSSSLLETQAKKFAENNNNKKLLFKIQVPKGSHVAPNWNLVEAPHEKEVVIQKDTIFEVLEIQETSDANIALLRIKNTKKG